MEHRPRPRHSKDMFAADRDNIRVAKPQIGVRPSVAGEVGDRNCGTIQQGCRLQSDVGGTTTLFG